MITFMLLVITLVFLVVFAVLFGSAFLLAFADVIVCGLILYGIYKLVVKNKKRVS